MLLAFFKINFFKIQKKSFRTTIRVSNCLDPDQDRRFVGPDQGPNCLQMLSVEIKVDASKERSAGCFTLIAY